LQLADSLGKQLDVARPPAPQAIAANRRAWHLASIGFGRMPGVNQLTQ
jgi:hypothetical protein